jgi:hypothetical protein
VPGQLVGENPVNGDFAAVELLDAPDLAGFQAGYVAINLIDAFASRTSCWCVRSMPCKRVSGLGSREGRGIELFFIPIPETLYPMPMRPRASFKFVRADLALHRIQELGPLVGLELGDQLPRLLGLAFRAGEIINDLVDLVEDLEDMGAFDTLIIVQGHGERLRHFRDSGFGNRVSGKKTNLLLNPDA